MILPGIDSHDFEITFPELINYQSKDYFYKSINEWFNQLKDLKPICELFYIISYGHSMYPRVYFLNLIQSIEGFHRRVYGDDNSEGKRYTLKERLTQLCEKRPGSLWFRYTMNGDETNLDKIIKIRNAFTHSYKKSENNVPSEKELYIINYKLKVLTRNTAIWSLVTSASGQ